MADDIKTEEEPSIEEILDSIRQIIADDDEEEDVDAVTVTVTEESVPDEPLDQSAIDDMDFNAPTPEPEPVSEPEAEEVSEPLDQSAIDDMDFNAPEPKEEEEVIELTEKLDADVDLVEPDPQPEEDPVSEPEPEPVLPELDPEPEPIIDATLETPPEANTDDGLLTKNAEDAAFAAISELARKTAVEHNGITLEDIVRSEIKPMLSAWLDKNLPIIIERLVQEELERVSKRVLED